MLVSAERHNWWSLVVHVSQLWSIYIWTCRTKHSSVLQCQYFFFQKLVRCKSIYIWKTIADIGHYKLMSSQVLLFLASPFSVWLRSLSLGAKPIWFGKWLVSHCHKWDANSVLCFLPLTLEQGSGQMQIIWIINKQTNLTSCGKEW